MRSRRFALRSSERSQGNACLSLRVTASLVETTSLEETEYSSLAPTIPENGVA